MANWPTRIVMPTTARRGEVIEIRTLVQHPMEPGYRRMDDGAPVPRDIIVRFVVTYADAEIFATDMQQGVAANPYFAFSTVAEATGDLVFTWTDEAGQSTQVVRRLTVT
jgi:sulfur-oxidizing protein SoxZ